MGVAFACILILVFLLQAKLGSYSNSTGGGSHLHPCSSSKLWVEANLTTPVLPLLLVTWFIARSFSGRLLRGEALAAINLDSLICHDAIPRYQRRFFRPPPVRYI